MTDKFKEFVYGIPKAELHLHIEGTLEPELKFKLAERNGKQLKEKTVEEIRDTYNFYDLPSFLKLYYEGMDLLQKREDFYDLVIEYFKKAQKQGLTYVEIFFDPQAHTRRGIPYEVFFEGYYDAVKEAPKYGIEAHLIQCFLRDMSAESAMEHYDMSIPYQDRILAYGLDSDEAGNPPAKFAEVFKRVKADGKHLTMHCDIDQVDSIGHIRQAIQELGTERIDHGTNIVEDPELVDELIAKKIPLTCCPVSNSFVTEFMKADEIVDLMQRGALVSIASDDPAYFGAYVADNLLALAENKNLTENDIITLVKNSFKSTFLPEAEKEKYLATVDEFVKNFNA